MSERMTVIVPCLNEEDRLESTVREIERIAPSLDLAVDIMMIDDGSTDGTHAVMLRIAAPRGYRVMRNEKNRGVGASLLAAYQMLDEDIWTTILPGDAEVDFSSIRNFVAMRHSYDVILGYLQNPVIRSAGRRVVSWAFTRTVSLIYGFPYRYLNGMKLFRISAFSGIDVESKGHAFNAELLAKAVLRNPHLRIGEAPFVARGRAEGISKAIRPVSIVQALYEVGAGWKSVVAYRHDAIKRTIEHK